MNTAAGRSASGLSARSPARSASSSVAVDVPAADEESHLSPRSRRAAAERDASEVDVGVGDVSVTLPRRIDPLLIVLIAAIVLALLVLLHPYLPGEVRAGGHQRRSSSSSSSSSSSPVQRAVADALRRPAKGQRGAKHRRRSPKDLGQCRRVPPSHLHFLKALYNASEAFNPIVPEQKILHHPVFSFFEPWTGEWEEGWVVDFLGLRTNYTYDCGGTGGYRKFVLSRAVPCNAYDDYRRHIHAGVLPPNALITAAFPPIDEEYFELVDVMESAVYAQDRYVIVEMGARYGTWAARGIAALRHVHPTMPYTCVGVEALPATFRWMGDHFRKNNITSTVLVNRFVSNVDDKEEEIRYEIEVDRVKTGMISTILRDLDHVDFLDLDIQGAESYALDIPEVIETLNTKVYRIHIGLHSPLFDEQLRKVFFREGWVPQWDFPTAFSLEFCDSIDYLDDATCHTRTPFGPVYFRDGAQSWYNPRLWPQQNRKAGARGNRGNKKGASDADAATPPTSIAA